MNTNHPMTPEETTASLSGGAKSDALRALRVLSETTEPQADEAETPPLPVALRDSWQEAYGENTKTSPAPVPVSTSEGWLRRLGSFFGSPRGAWAGGLTAAAAAIAVIVYQHDPGPGTPVDPLVTRGTSHGTQETGGAAPLIVVAPADKAGPLLTELGRAFPARRIERVDSIPERPADSIIIDIQGRGIWRRNPSTATALQGDPLANPDTVITAVEGLDDPLR